MLYVHTIIQRVYVGVYMYVASIYQVCTYMLYVHNMYVHGISLYVQVMYLYSTACLYNKSSNGVNFFCCSSSSLGIKPPSNAAA